MAKVRFAAALGAAAFSAGVALAAPLPAATAHADRGDRGENSAADDADAGDDVTARPARRSPVARAGAPGPAAARSVDTVSDSRVPRRGSAFAGIVTAAPPPLRATDGPAREPVAANAPATRVAEVVNTPVAAPVAAAATAPQLPSVAEVSAADGQRTIAPSPVMAVGAPAPASVAPAGSTPPAVMTVLPAVRANASSAASLIDNLLAPIRTIFGEGTALLVRRTFFNQAPSVTPVQLTGQSEGPITGTIGAVDPDGDKLTYSITTDPRYGSAVVNGDGSYTYTPATGFAGNDSFLVAVTDTGFHINLLDLFRPASTSASVAVGQGPLASRLRFQFIYGNGSQYWSSAARSSLESAATQLSSYIVVTSPVTITYAVNGQSTVLSSTLASAGSDFVSGDSGFLQTVVQNKIQTGYDANGSAADGTIDWNFGRSWGFGATVSSSQYDLTSIAMHELLHTFGLISNIDKAGSNTGQVWTLYDSYVSNAAGTRAINGTDYTWNPALDTNLTGGNGGLYFNGPHAVAANGGYVALYTPGDWQGGSSVSHPSGTRTLMSAVVSMGPGPRVLSPVELGILADIGYTVSTPGAPVLLFVGFVWLRPRRRKD